MKPLLLVLVLLMVPLAAPLAHAGPTIRECRWATQEGWTDREGNRHDETTMDPAFSRCCGVPLFVGRAERYGNMWTGDDYRNEYWMTCVSGGLDRDPPGLPKGCEWDLPEACPL